MRTCTNCKDLGNFMVKCLDGDWCLSCFHVRCYKYYKDNPNSKTGRAYRVFTGKVPMEQQPLVDITQPSISSWCE